MGELWTQMGLQGVAEEVERAIHRIKQAIGEIKKDYN